MNNLLYFFTGRKTVVNCTSVKFTRTAMKMIGYDPDQDAVITWSIEKQ